jgi:purine-nucleoside phosphorylase
MTTAYDPKLRELLLQSARENRIRMREGVYLAVSGPSYETRAEIEAFARLGADAVGMSTVPEAIVARHSGMRVAALSCITNPAAGRSTKRLSHNDVLQCALEAGRERHG